MPLSLEDQLNVAMGNIATGDIDRLSTLLTDPRTVTPAEQQSIAERLGFHGGILKFIVNTALDPTVWVAAFLSRRFSPKQYVSGMINKRHVGLAKEFTGVSLFTKPVEAPFATGGIPKLQALAMHRQAEVMKIGNQIHQEFDARGMAWKDEMPIVSMLLEGQNAPGATPELRALAQRVRGHFEELWKLGSQSKRIRGGFEGADSITKATAEDWQHTKAPMHLRDYLPHIPNLMGSGPAMVEMDRQAALKRMMSNRAMQAYTVTGTNPANVWQVDKMSSDFHRYQAFLNDVPSQIWNPRLMRRQRFNIPLQSQLGQSLWITDLNVITQRYVHAMARTYATNVPITPRERMLASWVEAGEDGISRRRYPTSDPIIVQTINQGLESVGGKFTQQVVPGTNKIIERYVPGSGSMASVLNLQSLTRAMQGVAREDEIIWGNLYSTARAKIDRRLEAIGVKTPVRDQVASAITAQQRNASYRNGSNGIAGFFYNSTLGLNTWSAIQNLLQPITTTMPSIGIGPTLKGYAELFRRVPRYMSELRNETRSLRALGNRNPLELFPEASERAFAKAFPELAAEGIKVDPRMFDIDPADLTNVGASKRMRTVKALNKLMLQPFTHAEMSNQVVTFFGAKAAIKDMVRTGEYTLPVNAAGKVIDGADLEQLINFDATQEVNRLQFRPGPGRKSYMQSVLPAPLGMFLTYPTNLYNHFAQSTLRGAMTAKQLETAGFLSKITGGRNMGTIARTMLYGKIAMNGARDVLGVDLSGALGLLSSFRGAQMGQISSPIPIPPLPQVVYGMASYASTRDTRDLQPLNLPYVGEIPFPKTLVPAGLAISRLGRAINQFRPDAGGFVDNNERLMYRGDNKDMIMAALGIPLDKARRARNTIDRLQENRSAIRDFRRRYAVKVMAADVEGMRKLQLQYAQQFKDMPPLDVSAKDVRRYQTNAHIPVVQRLARSMGRAGEYLESQIYAYDEDLVAPPQIAGFGGYPGMN